MKPFRYKKVRTVRISPKFGEIQDVTPKETLSGFIGQDKASDIEERFYRAMTKIPTISGASFRVPVISARNLPGQLEVDFVVTVGPQLFPIQVDGEYAHKGIGKKQDDARKDALINEFYHKYGAQLITRIDGEKLATQEMADNVAKELFG